jgi:pullulanase/glycogen debranching enzyme
LIAVTASPSALSAARKPFSQFPSSTRSLRKFFQGRRVRGSEVRGLVWFRADGEGMTEDDWNNPLAHSIALRLAGDAVAEVDDHGAHITDDTLLIVMSVEKVLKAKGRI